MEYFDYKPGHSNFDVEQFLEESTENEEQRLEDELERIEQQLESRDEIHAEAVDELESKLNQYQEQLHLLYKQYRGRRSGERKRLRNRIEKFYDFLREERRSHWRDRQELEQEIRELLREMDELEDTDALFELISSESDGLGQIL